MEVVGEVGDFVVFVVLFVVYSKIGFGFCVFGVRGLEGRGGGYGRRIIGTWCFWGRKLIKRLGWGFLKVIFLVEVGGVLNVILIECVGKWVFYIRSGVCVFFEGVLFLVVLAF